jgi:type IV pilus assembly protein PilC
MIFEYKARDALGKTHDGSIEAASPEDATQQLRRDGFHILSLEERSGGGGGLFPKRVSKQELIYTTSQLAIMVETGVTLSTAIESILAQEANPTLKRVLSDLKSHVEAGEDFSRSLERHPKIFDHTYVSLIRASESTGAMAEMLDRIAAYLRKEVETRGKVKSAMAYPMVMMTVAIAVVIFLLTYILPKFTPMFARKGINLPLPTKVMMAVSETMLNFWYLWILGFAAVIAAFIYALRTDAGRTAWDKIKISLPMFGPLFRKVSISRSIRTLGTMLSAGVPMLESLRLTSEVSGNVHYRALWRRVEDRVTGGCQVCDALSGDPLFPSTLVQMITAGEATGRLDMVLEKVSNFYDQEVEGAIKTTTSLIEPIMIAVMGVVVGGIGMSMLLPIFSLSKVPH